MKTGFESYDEKYENERFSVNDDKAANWAIKKIKEKVAEADRLKAIIAAEREELAAKEQAINERLDNETKYLKSLLFTYFGTVAHKETKTQESYKLLDGNLIFKKPSQKLVPDKEKLLAYLKANNMPEFVKVKEEVDWASYKKECEISDGKAVNVQTGDILPDDIVTVEEDPGSFDVKVVYE